MRLWVDDVRPAPDGWVWAKTAPEAISLLQTGAYDEVSLDHDLGNDDEGTGYTVACYIESEGIRVKWNCHSANPVGRKRIEMALKHLPRG